MNTCSQCNTVIQKPRKQKTRTKEIALNRGHSKYETSFSCLGKLLATLLPYITIIIISNALSAYDAQLRSL